METQFKLLAKRYDLKFERKQSWYAYGLNLTGFINNLPKEVEESAFIDGANIFQVIFKVVVPMSKSAIASSAIFVFLWSYNDLFLQMMELLTKI